MRVKHERVWLRPVHVVRHKNSAEVNLSHTPDEIGNKIRKINLESLGLSIFYKAEN